MKKKLSLILAIIISAAAVFSAGGCSNGGQSSQNGSSDSTWFSPNVKDLLDGVELYDVEGMVDESEIHPVLTDFSVKLAQKCVNDGENVLVSPISVVYAMTMAANGADGETLNQIEKTFGEDLYTLNRYLLFAMEAEYSGDPTKQSRSNALWINNGIGYKPESTYISDVRTFFDANLFLADFNTATDDINSWLSEKSGGKITDSGTKVTADDTMTLVNSLMFKANWINPYDPNNVKTASFTCADKTQKETQFLNSTENLYLSDENATGFIKLCEGKNYGLVALLPKEGMTPEEYIKSLTGEKLINLIKNAAEEKVQTSIPKLEQSDSSNLKDVLTEMGIKDAFDSNKANFTKMGKADKKLSLKDETDCEYISVDVSGINAGSSSNEAASVEECDKKVILDRPFVYMVFDVQSNTPKHIGICNKI